jgi:hypothetical protein
MKIIQRGLKQYVYDKVKVRIDDQSRDALLALMQAVFITNSENPYGGVQDQVKFMNKRVIEKASEQVLGGIAQYYGYMNDINKPLSPLDLPRSTTTYGNKIDYNDQIGF